MKAMLLALSTLIAVAATAVFAHSGGLDASGCHTNRKTGDYHCHRSPAPSRSQQLQQPTNSGSSSQLPAVSAVPATPKTSAAPINERQLIVSIQLLLISLGYPAGKADGSIGPATREAIINFQTDHFMEPNGNISGDLLVRLAEAMGKKCQ